MEVTPSTDFELTRFTHSCVRLSKDGFSLVIDPGVWAEPAAFEAADAVLLTHEHSDHADPARLAGLRTKVRGPASRQLADAGVRITRMVVGAELTLGPFTVRAIGGEHQPVYGRSPCANLGYLVSAGGPIVYHPGDALAAPDVWIDTLLVPLQASWLKTAEAIDFVRAVAPSRAYGIHDAQVNARGLGSLNAWHTREDLTDYTWLAPGTTVTIGT